MTEVIIHAVILVVQICTQLDCMLKCISQGFKLRFCITRCLGKNKQKDRIISGSSSVYGVKYGKHIAAVELLGRYKTLDTKTFCFAKIYTQQVKTEGSCGCFMGWNYVDRTAWEAIYPERASVWIF